MATRLLIKITHAHNDPERAHMGVNVAAAALASGLEVDLFLAADGVELALPDATFPLDEAPPVSELLDAVFAGAASVTACTPCATRRGLSEADFRQGTTLAGSAAFVAKVAQPDTTTLIY